MVVLTLVTTLRNNEYCIGSPSSFIVLLSYYLFVSNAVMLAVSCIAAEAGGPWPLLNFKALHRTSIFAIRNHLSLAKWPP